MAKKKNKAKKQSSAVQQIKKVAITEQTNTANQSTDPKSKVMERQDSNNKNAPKNKSISTKGIDLLKQFGLDNDINQTLIENIEDEQNIDDSKVKTEKVKGHVNSHADTIGWNKPLVLLKNLLFGFFMGLSDGTPGYSGGTTLTIIGFYQQLVSNFKMIFKPDVKKYFWKYLLWVLPFVIAWAGTLYGFMQIVNLASDNNMGVVLAFLFGSFALFSIPLFVFSNKSKMINFKDFKTATKKKEKWTIVHWVAIIGAFLILVGVGIGARFIPITSIADKNNPTEMISIQGVTFAKNQDGWVTNGSLDAMNILFLFLAGILAGFCMLIPGISGSLVLFMTTWYPKISQAMADFLTNVNYLPWLFVVGVGMIIGVILSTFTISYCLKRWEKVFYSASFGLILASPIAIFTALSSYEYAQLSDGTTLGLALGMIVVAIVVNILIFIALNETKKIDFPKYRIFNRTKTDLAQTEK